MSDIGVNRAGIDQNINLGKEIVNTGKGISGKEKALTIAKVNEGSEIVYEGNDGDWHVNELKEGELILPNAAPGVALFSAMVELLENDNLSVADKAEISLDAEKMKNAGINHPVISFVEDTASFSEKSDVAFDPKTDPGILTQLSKDKDDGIRGNVSANPNTTVETLNKLANDENFSIRSAVAGNPHTPAETLNKLADDKNYSVKIAVAGNPNTPKEILIEMAYETNENIRQALAKNPKTPKETLAEMKDDPSFLVKIALAENKNTPKDVLNKMATQKYQYNGPKFKTNSGISGLTFAGVNPSSFPVNPGVNLYNNVEDLNKALKENKSTAPSALKVMEKTLSTLKTSVFTN